MAKKLDVNELLCRLGEMFSDVDSSSDDNYAEAIITREKDGTGAVEAMVKTYQDIMKNQEKPECSNSSDSNGDDPDYKPCDSTCQSNSYTETLRMESVVDDVDKTNDDIANNSDVDIEPTGDNTADDPVDPENTPLEAKCKRVVSNPVSENFSEERRLVICRNTMV